MLSKYGNSYLAAAATAAVARNIFPGLIITDGCGGGNRRSTDFLFLEISEKEFHPRLSLPTGRIIIIL